MRLTEEQQAARRKRNWITFAIIIAFMLMVYGISVIQISRGF